MTDSEPVGADCSINRFVIASQANDRRGPACNPSNALAYELGNARAVCPVLCPTPPRLLGKDRPCDPTVRHLIPRLARLLVSWADANREPSKERR